LFAQVVIRLAHSASLACDITTYASFYLCATSTTQLLWIVKVCSWIANFTSSPR